MHHRQLLLFLLSICLAFPAIAAAGDERPTDVSVDLRDLGAPFRGWGTSLAWWAYGVGDWPEDKVDEIVRLVTDPQAGLGLNVFRYNIGGGDRPDHHHMPRWRDVPGFKPSPDAPYDWGADAAQRRVLLKLVKASRDRAVVEAFSNSPPWWMTVSGCVSGAADGGPNLKPEFESVLATYLADVAKFYKERHGLTFDSVEPFNEPDANWWKASGKQEGSNIPVDQQARLIRLTRAALDERGLRQTVVSATDANNLDDALTSVLSFDPPTLDALGQVNTHSYFGEKREQLRQAAAERGKRLWQSESGPLSVRGTEYEQAMVVAGRVVKDLNHLRPEVWCTWQIVGGGAWGCIHARPGQTSYSLGRMFDVLATFTRNIRPGDRLVRLDCDHVLVAVTPAHRVTTILVNDGSAPLSFRLAFHGAQRLPAATAPGIRCTADEAGLAPVEPVKFEGEMLKAVTPPQSVTALTFQCEP